MDNVNRNPGSHLTSVPTRNNSSKVSQHRYTKGGNPVQRETQPFPYGRYPAKKELMKRPEVTQRDVRAVCRRFFFPNHRQVLPSVFLVVTQSWSPEQGIPPSCLQGHLASKVGGLGSQAAVYSYSKLLCIHSVQGVNLDTELACD